MKVFWVLATEQYYPGIDNFEASFETKEEAEEYVRLENTYDRRKDWYSIINVSSRLGIEKEVIDEYF